MKTRLVEVETDGGDYGCFAVTQVEQADLELCSRFGRHRRLLYGYGPRDVLIVDMSTRQGAGFVLRANTSLASDLARRPFDCSGALLPFVRWLVAFAEQRGDFCIDDLPDEIPVLPCEAPFLTNPTSKR